MNLYFILIAVFLVGSSLFDLIVELLNVASVSPEIPAEFAGYYDGEKYAASQNYLKEKTLFSLIGDGFWLAVSLVFIYAGGFNFADRIARGFGFGEILTGLVFAGLLFFASQPLRIPFSIYETFVIEEKYGFNKTTPATFIADLLKGWLLGLVLGGGIFAVILWLFGSAGSAAWAWCALAVILFQLFAAFIAPVTILPLFNKFIPLDDGGLKESIEAYASSQSFALGGLYKMDGSRRSTKSNAFFTGFGRFRRIALFDTLIAGHTVEEIVSILAHEIGHYKKRHILKSLALSAVTTVLMFFILSLFIGSRALFDAFGMEYVSAYAGIVFFGFLYSPISMILSVLTCAVSRTHEYEADRFAVETYGRPDAFVDALKKLSVNNLSNLTPHRLKVIVEYTHPPVLERIKEIRSI